MNSDSIPVDLITEILSRLPQKSIARFRCVSKLWASIFQGPYFTELFLTMSSAQPRILFAVVKDDVWRFFSLPQRLMSPYEKSSSSSLVVPAKFHTKLPPENMAIVPPSDRDFSCGYASGLIYFYSRLKKKEDNYEVPVIFNPNTGQYVTLPYLPWYTKAWSFLWFDQVDKQFKVLVMADPGCSYDHKIMTLGTKRMWWRTIKCPFLHDPSGGGICINGVLYYLGYVRPGDNYVIFCFDVRSEKFKFMSLESCGTLINYKGKLCVVNSNYSWKSDATIELSLYIWILEDAEKEKWSKYAYTLRDDKFVNDRYVVGVTSMGEIILSMESYLCNQPFYVFYFNPQQNTLQRVEIEGFGEYCFKAPSRQRVFTFANHVEDLKVNDPKLLNSSIYATYVKREKEEEDDEEKENEKSV